MLSKIRKPIRAPGASAQAVRNIRNLLSPEQFSNAVHRESARVDRGEGDLTLVLFKLVNPRRKKLALSTIRLIRLLISRVRVTDDLGWFDREHVGLLLPNTTAGAASALVQSICNEIESRGAVRPQCRLYSYPAESQIAARPCETLRVAS